MNIQHWFTGMVEDISDPNGMGRVRVRCFGWHVPKERDADGDGTPDLDTPDLLWAPCLLPIDNPAINGIASSPGALMPGSMVMGFFRDGEDMQDPIVIGGISNAKGYDTKYNENMGFGDPNNIFSYSSFNEDFPEDSGSLSAVNGASNRFSQYSSSFVGEFSGGPSVHPSSFEEGEYEPLPPGNGTIEDLIKGAMSEANQIVERGENNHPALKKYWDSLGRPGGYNSRLAWCAAFVCYHIKNSGILPPGEEPRTADSTAFEEWAKRKPYCKVIHNPRQIKAGDIIKFRGRHVGLARADSDGEKIYTIEGNAGAPRNNSVGVKPGHEGCWAKDKHINQVAYVVRMNVAQTTPLPEEATHPYPPTPTPKNKAAAEPFVAGTPEWNPNLNENENS